MFDFLDKLRQKPEGTRRVIAFGTVSVISFFISLVWLSTLQARLGYDEEMTVAKNAAQPLESIAQTASVFWGNVNESFERGAAAFDQYTESEETFVSGVTVATSTKKEKFGARASDTSRASSSTSTSQTADGREGAKRDRTATSTLEKSPLEPSTLESTSTAKVD